MKEGAYWDHPSPLKSCPHIQVGGTRIAQLFPNWLNFLCRFLPRQGEVRKHLKSQDPSQTCDVFPSLLSTGAPSPGSLLACVFPSPSFAVHLFTSQINLSAINPQLLIAILCWEMNPLSFSGNNFRTKYVKWSSDYEEKHISVRSASLHLVC